MRTENDGKEDDGDTTEAPSFSQFHNAIGNQYVRKTVAR